jgi:hypothetical protein
MTMMPDNKQHIKYDTNLLKQICDRDKCIIDFSKFRIIGSKSKIEFVCPCGTTHEKQFASIYQYGGLCPTCIKPLAREKVKQTCLRNYGTEHNMLSSVIKEKRRINRIAKQKTSICNTAAEYDKTLLESICERDKCTIDFSKIESYSSNKRFDFICNCGNSHNKEFRGMLNQGAFCKYCMKGLSLQRQKKAALEKYGKEFIAQVPEIRAKIKDTLLKKFGVENPMQSEVIKERNKQTCLKKYNKEFTLQTDLVKNKAKETWMAKHNVPHIRQSEYYKQKFTETCMQKYNVPHHSQDADIAEKQANNAYNFKTFTFPCGNTMRVQGYEPFLLDILVSKGYTFQDILTKRNQVPEIWYEKNGKKSRYYCDAFIPQNNTIYEVKSAWTYKNGFNDLMLKKQACIEAGYNFELHIFSQDGTSLCF